jgi:hypothetical protein
VSAGVVTRTVETTVGAPSRITSAISIHRARCQSTGSLPPVHTIEVDGVRRMYEVQP